MGRRVESSLNQQVDLVSVDVGAMAWNSAKANDAFVNCVGCTMPHGSYCKGQCQAHVRSGVAARRWVQRRKLYANLSLKGLWVGRSHQRLRSASVGHCALVEQGLPWLAFLLSSE